ncbi:hypothetical protein [Microbacterium fluvii]
MILLIAQFVIAVALAVSITFLWSASPHCGDSCEYSTLTFATYGFFALAGVLLLGAGLGVFLLRDTYRRSLIPPLIGVALTVLGATVAITLGRASLGF